MASLGPTMKRPEGRIIPFFHPNVRVERRRLGAAVLDLLILLVVAVWLGNIFGLTRIGVGAPVPPVAGGHGFGLGALIVAVLCLPLLAIVGYSVQEALFGATWGKYVAGLRVVALDGARPRVGAIVVRNLLRLVDFLPCLYALGAATTLTSPRRQRLGDRVAGTLVVGARSAPLACRTRQEMRHGLLGLGVVLALMLMFCLCFSYFGRPPLVIADLATAGTLPHLTPGNVASFDLGTPRWGRAAVSYPVRFTTVRGHERCAGTIVLRWDGLLGAGGGWRLAASAVRCQ